MMATLAWLIPLAPLFAAAWIGLGMAVGWNRGEAGERETAFIALSGASVSLLLLLFTWIGWWWQGPLGLVEYGDWFQVGDYRVPLNLLLDGLGLGIASLFGVLCLISIRFSIAYLHREEGFQRFFMLLSLFTAAMLLIVTAGNALLAFVGWELAGLSSYLLISFAQGRHEATGNGVRAFVTNRLGDSGFIVAIALSYSLLGGVNWSLVANPDSELKTLAAGLLASGFVLAALVKSAAFPFSAWIARALEGPTPSSAIFYGAVMVHAGVFLLIRIADLLQQAPLILLLLFVVGLLTALYGWLVGLAQSDVKSSLIFATTSHIGLMLMACGMGWFQLAAWHLALHGIWRAWQFFHAPALAGLVKTAQSPPLLPLDRVPGLHTASLRRLWLDPAGDWLLVRPIQAVARDLQEFEEKVVAPIAGLGENLGRRISRDGFSSGRRGPLGNLLDGLATLFQWFEERLVLQGGGAGLKAMIRRAGTYLTRIDELLSEPRYLILMIVATFVVII